MSWIEDQGVSLFGDFNLTELDIDEAWINVTTSSRKNLWLYELSTNCQECPFQLSSNATITKNQPLIKKIKTVYPLTYRLRTSREDPIIGVANDSQMFCELSHHFGEFGVYDLQASERNKDTGIGNLCEIITKLEPVNIYFPILISVLFYSALAIVWYIVSKHKNNLKACYVNIFNRFTQHRGLINTEPSPSSSTANLIPENKPIIKVTTQDPGTSESSGGATKSKSKKRKTKNSPARSQKTGQSPSEASSLSGEDSGVARLPRKTNDQDQKTFSDPTHRLQSEECRQSAEQNVKTVNLERLRFLDTFRGICIVMMIFVNDGGADYYFLEHATWDGLYIADVIFPWFLMGMGISIPLSITGQLRRGNSKWDIFRNISIRSCKLIFIGIVLNSAKGSDPPNLALLRLPGVLQRFGVCYFVVASLFLIFSARKVNSHMTLQETETSPITSALIDWKILWLPWLIIALILIIHYVLTFFLHNPGCPTGYLGPGGLHHGNAYPAYCVGGAAGYIDRMVFSKHHIYKWPTSKSVYKSDAYDPEGFLGLLNSIGQVWFGLQTGVTLLLFPKTSSRVIRWFTLAVLTGLIGLALCEGKQTGGMIPLNKNLWSLSYTLVTTSLALILFSVLYIIVDVKLWWSGSPFFECGMNSIALYVGHTIAYSMLPWHYTYGKMSTHFSRLVEALWGTSLWVLIAVYLYSKRLFYTV